MTNEEALEILKSIEILSFRDKKRKYFMRDVWKAQKVAIKALEQQPSEDCISRAEALRHRHIIYDDDGVGYSVVRVDEIEQLPSVNPEGENFTDEEKRIFLASVAREMRVCEQIDSEKTTVKLVPILERVKDKVLRSSLWKESDTHA